jgi:hypothetical protein
VVGELYESYFLPQRHEFDWQVLHEIVTIMTGEPMKEFFFHSAAASLVGTGAAAALSAVLKRIIAEIKKTKMSGKRQRQFLEKGDKVKIELFFSHPAFRPARD